MEATSLSRRFREDTAGIWSGILGHPFVRGIGDGSLPRKKFAFYLKQDYVYLIELSRVLALASAKAGRLSQMSYLAGLLEATLNTEMELHRRTCADFGITGEELAAVEPAPVTRAYSNLLVRTCYEGRFSDITAVLLPCEQGYAEIACALEERGLPEESHCRDWIETYSSKEFLEFARWVADQFDETAAGASDRDAERWFGLYLAATRYEFLFFEMGWTMQTWSDLIPG